MTQMDSSQPPVRERVAGLLEDWATIWESELAALAVDREAHEWTQRMVRGWVAQARAMLAAGASGLDAAGGPAGAAATPGAAPAAAAPDGRDAWVGELLDRVAALERRLAGLERG